MKTFFTTMRKTELKFKRFLLFYVFAAIIAAVVMVISNRLSGDLSTAATEGNVDVIFNLFIFITIITIVRMIISALQTFYMARFSAKASYNLRQTFVKHFLRAPFSKVEFSGSGESLSIYQNDTIQTSRFITSEVLTLIEHFITFISAFSFMLSISVLYTGISFLAAIVLLAFISIIMSPIQNFQVTISKKQAAFNAVVNDSLQNLSTIISYNLDKVMEERYTKVYQDYFASVKKFLVFIGLLVSTSFMMMFGPLVAIFIVLGLAVINGNLYLSDFIAFSLTVTLGAASIMMLGQGISRLSAGLGRAKRYNEFTSSELELEGDPEETPPKEVTISFKNVSFSYPVPEEEKPKKKKKGGLSISVSLGDSNEPVQTTENPDTNESTESQEPKSSEPKVVINNLNFEIKSNTKTAIVGGSGSGKSTILKLLLGLYYPTEGEILVNGTNVTDIPKGLLRKYYSYVPQDSFLFPTSIRENITMDKSFGVSLEQACEDAGIIDFINSLPEKYEGVLTESAENVSGGQRQRIALARAFYRNSPIILFDEATSALDSTTEAGILSSLERSSAGKSVIMVAHRPSAIAACDTIIVLDEGGILSGIGTHDELLANNEIYKNLYERGVN